MPHGGKRQRAGRPPGSRNKRFQLTRAMVGNEDYSPLQYLVALMRNEQCEATRRDAAAVQAAPYLHARLNAVSTSNVPGRDGGGGGDISIIQIVAVPRGGRLDPQSGTITIDGEVVTEPPSVEPFAGTPALELTDQRAPPAPIAEPLVERLPVIEVPDDGKVMRLDTFKNRREDDDPAGGAA